MAKQPTKKGFAFRARVRVVMPGVDGVVTSFGPYIC